MDGVRGQVRICYISNKSTFNFSKNIWMYFLKFRSMYALQDSIREDSEIGKHQRQRRRSSFIDETFRKWVPLYFNKFLWWFFLLMLGRGRSTRLRWAPSDEGVDGLVKCASKISAEKFRLKEGSGLNSGKREQKPTPTPQMKRTKIQFRDSDRTGLENIWTELSVNPSFSPHLASNFLQVKIKKIQIIWFIVKVLVP